MQLTNILLKVKKSSRKYLQTGFRDTLRVYVQGGAGGNGYPKFGGVGGKGGDVKVIAKEGITLENVFKSNKMKRYLAGNGKHSTHNFILGPPGEDLEFEVPVGVTIFTDIGKKLGELNNEGQQLIIAKGGSGGHSKNGFLGVKGQAYSINLDLKLIADIGLVGFPNAGKSTLLKAISHAKPKIASYPFTTIKPNVGVIQYKDLRQITMADLPGLIEGASANRGMGHKFLKHVERTKLLLMIVDINGFQLSPQYPHRSCLETILLLNQELELYNEDLLNKPAMLLVNKMDTEGALEKYNEVNDQIKNLKKYLSDYEEKMRPKNVIQFCDIVPISAKSNQGDVELVKQKLRNILDVMADLEQDSDDRNLELYDEVKEKIREKGPQLI